MQQHDPEQNLSTENGAQEEGAATKEASKERVRTGFDKALLAGIIVNLVAIFAVLAHMQITGGAWSNWSIANVLAPLHYFRDDTRLCQLLSGSLVILLALEANRRGREVLPLVGFAMGATMIIVPGLESLLFFDHAARFATQEMAGKSFQVTSVGIDASETHAQAILTNPLGHLKAELSEDNEARKKFFLVVTKELADIRRSGAKVTVLDGLTVKFIDLKRFNAYVDEFSLCDANGQPLSPGQIADLYYAIKKEKDAFKVPRQYRELQ